MQKKFSETRQLEKAIHIHEYQPTEFWRADYGWLVIYWRCEAEDGLSCDRVSWMEAYMKEDKR